MLGNINNVHLKRQTWLDVTKRDDGKWSKRIASSIEKFANWLIEIYYIRVEHIKNEKL